MTATIWITGVTGFTGGHLLQFINGLPEKHYIVGLSRHERSTMAVDSMHNVDLSQVEMVAEAARRDPPSRVFHLTGLFSPPASEAEMWHINVGGTVALLHGLALANCHNASVICVGSAAEYLPSLDGCFAESSACGGVTSYGRTKWAQTTLALLLGKQLNIPIMVVRPFNLIGPGLSRRFVAGELAAQFACVDNKEISVGNTKSERDFIDVRDVVAAYWEVAEKGTDGEVYNVCSGTPTSIEDIITIFSELAEGSRTIIEDQSRMRAVDIDRAYGDNEKIIRVTGWNPRITLRDSLADMLDEARQS